MSYIIKKLRGKNIPETSFLDLKQGFVSPQTSLQSEQSGDVMVFMFQVNC